MNHVFLVGFMGAGKSTTARLVAARTGRPCLDLDALIESEAGFGTAEIFARQGEDAFRSLESQVLASLAAVEPSVVACGGGVVIRAENRAELRAQGTVVYLKVTPGEAIARIGDLKSRPLLSGSGATLAATTLLKARESLYRSVADVEVDTAGRDADTVAEEVVAALREEGLG